MYILTKSCFVKYPFTLQNRPINFNETKSLEYKMFVYMVSDSDCN